MAWETAKIDLGDLSPKKLNVKADLYIDGGHNSSAGLAISEWLNTLNYDALYIIIGMMNNKDLTRFLLPFKSKIHKLYGMTIPNQVNSFSSYDISKVATRLNIANDEVRTFKDALNHVKEDHIKGNKCVLICGSLYLVGHFLEENGVFN